MKKQALGRGLDAILEAGPAGGASALAGAATPSQMNDAMQQVEREAAPMSVAIERVSAGRGQPRRYFDEGRLEALAETIREQGVLQPLVVTRSQAGYELVAGERRLRAAARAGLARVPVIVRQELSEAELVELALVENLQREDLGPLEEARAYQRLIVEHGYTQQQVAKKVGRSRAAVANMVRLLGLPAVVREALEEGLLSEGHARALLGLATAAQQIKAARRVMKKGLSVRETELLVKAEANGGGKAQPASPLKAVDGGALALEKQLCGSFATRVRIRGNGNRGRIELYFSSQDELGRLVDRLTAT